MPNLEREFLVSKSFSAKSFQTGFNNKRANMIDGHSQPEKVFPGYFVLKRFFDITFSVLFILFILSWLFPLIALLIKLDSKGPVLFIQRRTGFLNNDFLCYKFRTMCKNEKSESHQAVYSDPRITRIGHFLRNTNLDELPQFINVLKGDMSVIGPRPHMLHHTNEFSEKIKNYLMRHDVKPGITGMAQIKGWRGPTPNYRSIYKRVQWDIYYIRHQSAWLDTYIFLATISEGVMNLINQLFTLNVYSNRKK